MQEAKIGSTVGKVVLGLAIVVGVAALALTGVGLIVGPAAMVGITAALGGVTAAMLSTAAAVLSIGASLLSPRPKPPGLGAGTLDRLNISVDPNTPRKAVFGRTALNTDMRDQEVENIAGTTDDLNVHRWIVMAAHKVQALDEIWFDDELVWTLAGGVVNATYQGFLTVTPVLEGTSGNYINYGGKIAASARRYTGCAYVYFKYFINSESPFAGSIPTRITLRGKGMPTYDPRKDTTVSGGSGTQRADNNSTWSFDSGGNLQGDNPVLQLLSWLLGWKIAGKLSVGKGIPMDRLDMPSFITAANICDESVSLAAGGSERRYRAAGVATEGEEMTSVTDRWKSAMAADLDDVDGKIRITIYVNDLGAPVVPFTEDDVLDSFEWHPSNNLLADYNEVGGRYVNPSDVSLYQLSEYPTVKLTSRDGITRKQTLDFGCVQSQSQSERLAKQWLQRAQYPGTFKATFQFTGHKAQKGDLVTLTFGPLGFNARPMRVLSKEYRGDGTVPMVLRDENAATYAWANNDSAVVVYAQPTVYSAADTPWQQMITGNWAPPAQGAQDANLLKDAQFGISYWSRTGTLANLKRLKGSVTNSGQFPIDSVQEYVGEIALGNNQARNFSYNKKGFPKITVGRLYYIVFNVAKGASGMSGTATVRGTLQFTDDANAAVGSPVNVDVTLAALPAGGAYLQMVGSLIAPATATRAVVTVGVTANTAGGKIRLDNPKLLDKEPGSDVTLTLTGSPSEIFKYDYTGVAESGQFPRNLVYKLLSLSGDILAGVAWTYKVPSGTVNGFNSGSAAQAMTGTGYGTLVVNSLGAAVNAVDVYAAYNGRVIGPFRTALAKDIAPAPASEGGGGGGAAASQSSGFTSYSSTTYVATTIALQYEQPAGHTQVRLSANLYGRPNAGVAAGSWTSNGKWQQETSPGSGTWNDVGTIVTSDSATTNVGTPEEPVIEVAYEAELLKTVDVSLAAGVTGSFRFAARITSGTKVHTVSGTASVSTI